MSMGDKDSKIIGCVMVIQKQHKEWIGGGRAWTQVRGLFSRSRPCETKGPEIDYV